MFPPVSVEDWQNLVIGRLPPADQVIARNFGLTAQYAQWYRVNRGIFKWAGMASFSSRRVGLALKPYQIIVDVEQILQLENPGIPPGDAGAGQIVDIANPEIPLAHKAEILPGLNLLRETNNAVFKDIGWAHEAYVQGGLAAVETATGADPKFAELKRGFQRIDWGKQHLQSNAAEADNAIWEGNMILLEHEQRDIIQPRLATATVLFDTFLSSATVMQYWVNPFHIHPFKMTVFPLAMVVFNLPFLLSKNRPPDFRSFDQRWSWIKARVVPIFRRLDGSDPEIITSIAEIIAAATQITPPAPPIPGGAPPV